MSLWASTTAPKVPLDAADGDEAESVRVRFRERVSSPCGEDGEVEPACHPPGGGGCAALFPSSRCMEEKFRVLARHECAQGAAFADDSYIYATLKAALQVLAEIHQRLWEDAKLCFADPNTWTS